MKRAIRFLIVLCMLPVLCSCSRQITDRDTIIGSWEADIRLSVLGISVSADKEQTAEAIYRLELQEDGTGRSSITVSSECTDPIPDIETDLTFSYNDGKLELTHENGSILSFSVSFSEDKLILDGRTHIELVRIK